MDECTAPRPPPPPPAPPAPPSRLFSNASSAATIVHASRHAAAAKPPRTQPPPALAPTPRPGIEGALDELDARLAALLHATTTATATTTTTTSSSSSSSALNHARLASELSRTRRALRDALDREHTLRTQHQALQREHAQLAQTCAELELECEALTAKYLELQGSDYATLLPDTLDASSSPSSLPSSSPISSPAASPHIRRVSSIYRSLQPLLSDSPNDLSLLSSNSSSDPRRLSLHHHHHQTPEQGDSIFGSSLGISISERDLHDMLTPRTPAIPHELRVVAEFHAAVKDLSDMAHQLSRRLSLLQHQRAQQRASLHTLDPHQAQQHIQDYDQAIQTITDALPAIQDKIKDHDRVVAWAEAELERQQASRKHMISGEQMLWELQYGVYYILADELKRRIEQGDMAWLASNASEHQHSSQT